MLAKTCLPSIIGSRDKDNAERLRLEEADKVVGNYSQADAILAFFGKADVLSVASRRTCCRELPVYLSSIPSGLGASLTRWYLDLSLPGLRVPVGCARVANSTWLRSRFEPFFRRGRW